MLQNVVQYLAHKENVRHNLRSEELSGEQNRINDSHYQRMDAETNRSNLAKETETNRSNLAKEKETKRHNVVTELQGWQQANSQAALNRARTKQQKEETKVYTKFGEAITRSEKSRNDEQANKYAAEAAYTQTQDENYGHHIAQGYLNAVGTILRGASSLIGPVGGKVASTGKIGF